MYTSREHNAENPWNITGKRRNRITIELRRAKINSLKHLPWIVGHLGRGTTSYNFLILWLHNNNRLFKTTTKLKDYWTGIGYDSRLSYVLQHYQHDTEYREKVWAVRLWHSVPIGSGSAYILYCSLPMLGVERDRRCARICALDGWDKQTLWLDTICAPPAWRHAGTSSPYYCAIFIIVVHVHQNWVIDCSIIRNALVIHYLPLPVPTALPNRLRNRLFTPTLSTNTLRPDNNAV